MKYEADYTPEQRRQKLNMYRKKIKRNVRAFVERSYQIVQEQKPVKPGVYIVGKKKTNRSRSLA